MFRPNIIDANNVYDRAIVLYRPEGSINFQVNSGRYRIRLKSYAWRYDYVFPPVVDPTTLQPISLETLKPFPEFAIDVAPNNSVIVPITSTLQDMDFTFMQSTNINNHVQYRITNTIPKYDFSVTPGADPLVDPTTVDAVTGWSESVKSLYNFDTEITGKVALGNVALSYETELKTIYPAPAGFTYLNHGKNFDRMQALVLNFQLERIID